jgi:predicted GNAT family acetyltransferase
MTEMTITHQAISAGMTASGGEFTATLPGETATGQLTYVMRGPVMVAEHTLVPSAIGGRGVAARLVEALIAHAREQGLKVVPQCSYVDAAFRRHPEWRDVLA